MNASSSRSGLKILVSCAAGGAGCSKACRPSPRLLGIGADQRGNRVQRVEQEVRIDLAGERCQTRLIQPRCCASSFFSLRVLFQIFSGRVTAKMRARVDASISQQEVGLQLAYRARTTVAWGNSCATASRRNSANTMHQQARQMLKAGAAQILRSAKSRQMLRSKNGEKRQMSSVSGATIAQKAAQHADAGE